MEKIKKGTQQFFSEQYEEFVPPKVKKVGRAFKTKVLERKQTLQERSRQGKEEIKNIMRRNLPQSKRFIDRKKKKRRRR